jgi:hypothetical protein
MRLDGVDPLRIAIAGAHCTGKTTLVEHLASKLDPIRVIPEPYYEILAEGGSFSHPPVLEDYELQLERAIHDVVALTDSRAIFDRCPADFLSYLMTFGSEGNEAVQATFRDAADALASFDLFVFVPIERPDRIGLSPSEHPRLRWQMETHLRDILIDDIWGLDLPVLEVRGSPSARARIVLDRLGLQALE